MENAECVLIVLVRSGSVDLRIDDNEVRAEWRVEKGVDEHRWDDGHDEDQDETQQEPLVEEYLDDWG